MARSLNQVAEDGPWMVRRRRAWVPLALVNALMRWMDCRSRFLAPAEWAHWESTLHEATTGAPVRFLRDGVAVGRLPGVPMRAWLIQESEAGQVRALAAAFRSLGDLHGLVVAWPDGVRRAFSHADAGIYNVLYQPALDRASWLDFETLHEPGWSPLERQADDLRALVCSAAMVVPPALAVRAMLEGYPRRSVVAALATARPAPFVRALYHVAQAPLSLATKRELEARLRTIVEEDSP